MTKRKRAPLVLLGGLALPMLTALPAAARVDDDMMMRQGLSGSAELGYVSYDASENGRKVLDASSFVQKYSLLYYTRGKTRIESRGSYKLAIGYEWSSIDASVSGPGGGTDQSVRSGRPLFDGSFTLNPPTAPFELSAYSRDLGRNTFTNDTLPELSNGNRILAPDLPTEITQSGTNIESGVRLVIADKHRGRGKLGDLLTGVPAIYIDYWDLLSRNTHGAARLDSRSSRLSVSAGGIGDTWLHYQSSSFTDKYFSLNSYDRTRIMFGTINQYQRRKWVQFTNWIKLSADARFEQTKYRESGKGEEEFDLNIFGMATRRLWEAKVFSNYNRKIVDRGAPEEILRLPLYVNGVLGADTDWSMSASTTEHHVGGGVSPESRSSEDNLSVRLNTFKRSPFTLTTALSLINNKDSDGNGYLGADLSLESVSTSRFARTVNLAGSYALRTRYNRANEEYSYNQDLLLSAYYQPAPAWKLSFRETITQGRNDSSATTDFSSSRVAQGQNPLGGVTSLTTPTSNFLRLATTASVAWTPIARFTASVSGTNYLQIESTGESMSNAVSAGLSYSQPTYSASVGGSMAAQDNGDKEIAFETRLLYKPNRNLEVVLRGQQNRRESYGATYNFVDAAQRLTYYIWGSAGVSRKVADLYEEVVYLEQNGETPRKALTLGGTYYLYARVSLNGRASYSMQNGSLAQIYGVGLVANMKLLDATVDYTYAKRTSDKRVENRLAATLKKSF